jgi:hypothetical protein
LANVRFVQEPTLSVGYSLVVLPHLNRPLERFRAKACPGLDPGWIPVRVKKTRQNNRARF